MPSTSPHDTYRDFLDRQMELWNRRLAGISSATSSPGKARTLARMKAARASLGRLLAGLGADRSRVPDEIRAESQSVLSELGRLWNVWEGKGG